MKYTLDHKTLERTRQCRFDRACLDRDDYPLCRPIDLTDDLTAVCKCPGNHCPSRLEFKHGTYCSCPTRSALFMKYGR